MSLLCRQSVPKRLGIYRTQIRPSEDYIVAIRVSNLISQNIRTVDTASDWLIANLDTVISNYWMRFLRIQKNQGWGRRYKPKPKARLITLTEILIILDITKTSSNNCLLPYANSQLVNQKPCVLPWYLAISSHRLNMAIISWSLGRIWLQKIPKRTFFATFRRHIRPLLWDFHQGKATKC